MPMPSMNNARVRVCVDGLRCLADPTASTSPLRPRTCPPSACRVPARTNGRPLETAAPNALICLPERPEQVPLAARQIGGYARGMDDRAPAHMLRPRPRTAVAAHTGREPAATRSRSPGRQPTQRPPWPRSGSSHQPARPLLPARPPGAEAVLRQLQVAATFQIRRPGPCRSH
jgi:hypothetical protein